MGFDVPFGWTPRDPNRESNAPLQWTKFTAWTLDSTTGIWPIGSYKLINCFETGTYQTSASADAAFISDAGTVFILRDVEFSLHSPRVIRVRNLNPSVIDNLQVLRYPIPISSENTLEFANNSIDANGSDFRLDPPAGLPQCSSVYTYAEFNGNIYENWVQPGNGNVVTLPASPVGTTYNVRRLFRGVL